VSDPAVRATIIGTGYHVPEKILTNADLERMVSTSDEWIRTRTGICQRRIAEKGTGSSDLAAKAAEKALAQAGLKAEELDLIIAATTTPDAPLPSCACYLQAKIGATRAAAFDLAAACAGFLYGMVTAEQYIRSGLYRNILVVGADMISSFIDWNDRSTCVLFGDGAGAAIVSATTQGGILSSILGSDGRYTKLLTIAAGGSRRPASAETLQEGGHYLKMNGSDVFKLAVRGMADATLCALEKAGVSPTEVACFIPHQANLRIIDAVADRLKLNKEKIFTNLDRYGNTSAASCPIALCEALEAGRIKKGDKIVFATFGAGMVWGALVMEWSR